MAREFYVVIEQDESGVYIGEVPQLRACYTQANTLDELSLEDSDKTEAFEDRRIIGIQKVAI